jgi:hypothetical protein
MSSLLGRYIDCANKDDSDSSILKRLIMMDSNENLYLAIDNTGLISNPTTLSFTQANLQDITIDGIVHSCYLATHNLGTYAYNYAVKNQLGALQIISESPVDVNSTYLIIDSVITGTWTVSFFPA